MSAYGRAIHSLPADGPGSAGGGSTPSTTSYVQHIAVPDTTWTVTHPLGTDTPIVFLYSEDGHWLGDADVYVPDNSTVIVTWAIPIAGKAVIRS